ncbi:MAG: hypothetical protein L3J26_13760 [Candidatus Polarisedimenticolaceae bacterium]|nr:hypothetical protein [Candidatus Polarisedimenticolaceae bacterium]
MSIFINAKSWQVFLVMMVLLALTAFLPSTSDISFGFEAGMVVFIAFYFSWLCTIGIFCNKKCPEELQKTPKIMLISLAYAAIYSLLFNLLLSHPEISNDHILPFHMAAMGCMFYSLGYVAKRLIVAQRGEQVTFIEYFGALIMFWFFPIGVWFVQPKVNAIFND